MKKTLLTMMAAVVALTSAAELRDDAFIIRTTDGAAQGLLFGDVEKITFSNLDDEGIPHTGIYYQELHFPDTIIRTPVTDIRCVSFEKPKSILQPNVVMFYETGMDFYLSRIQDMVFYFGDAMPDYMLPKEGQILASLDPKRDLGVFAYRVKAVRKNSGAIEVECEKVKRIQDIYAELYGVEAVTEDTPGVRECLRNAGAECSDYNGRRVSGGGKSTIPFDINLDFDVTPKDDEDAPSRSGVENSFHLAGGIKGELELRIAYDFSKTRDYLSVGTTYEYTPYFSFKYQSEAKWEKTAFNPIQKPFISVTPPSCPIFTVSFGAAPFFRALGSATIELSRTFPTTHTRTLAIYEDGTYMSRTANVNSDDDPDNTGKLELNLTIDGSIMVGANMALYVGTTRILDTAIGIVAEANVGPKISGSIGGSLSNMPTFEGPNTILHDMIKNWNVSATWCSVELAISYYQQILGGEEEKVSLINMSCDADPWSATVVPDLGSVEIEKVRHSKYSEPITEGYPLGSQYESLSFTVPYPEGTWLFNINPGWAIYENDKFYKAVYSFLNYESGVDYSDNGDLVWEFNEWHPNRTYKIYPAYKFRLWRDGVRVDSPVTFSYPATVTTGPTSYNWLSKDIVECSFSGHSDLEPFILNPYFNGRGFIISEQPLPIGKDGVLSDYNPVDPGFEFILEDRQEGVDYARPFNCKTTSLKDGTHYYYCAAVNLTNNGTYGRPIYYCGEAGTFYVPISSNPYLGE